MANTTSVWGLLCEIMREPTQLIIEHINSLNCWPHNGRWQAGGGALWKGNTSVSNVGAQCWMKRLSCWNDFIVVRWPGEGSNGGCLLLKGDTKGDVVHSRLLHPHSCIYRTLEPDGACGCVRWCPLLGTNFLWSTLYFFSCQILSPGHSLLGLAARCYAFVVVYRNYRRNVHHCECALK